MAVELWIDEIARLFEISDGKGGTVRSYRVYERAEFPEAITVYPCALTYTVESRNGYSLGGPDIDLWNGVTEFHLFPNLSRANYPALMLYFARIRNAAAGKMTLSGLVDHFLLRQDVPSVSGPVQLRYGGEDPHLGLVVNWEVKETVSGDFVPAA